MKAIENFISAVMDAFPSTPETEELRANLQEHMEDKWEALCAEGLNEYEALGRVVAEFGSVEELRAGLGMTDSLPPAATGDSDPELSDLLLEYNLFRPKRRMAAAVSVVLFILAPFLAAAAAEHFFSLAPLLFAGPVALGIGVFVYFRGRARDYRERIRDRRAQLGLPQTPPEGGAPFPHEREERKNHKRLFRTLNATLPIWVTLIYLYIGTFWKFWHPGWLIFFVIPLYYATMGSRAR